MSVCAWVRLCSCMYVNFAFAAIIRLILFSKNIDKVLYVPRQRRQNNEIIPKLVYDFLPIESKYNDIVTFKILSFSVTAPWKGTEKEYDFIGNYNNLTSHKIKINKNVFVRMVFKNDLLYQHLFFCGRKEVNASRRINYKKRF